MLQIGQKMKTKTVSQILKTCKVGDVLRAGNRKWVVVDGWDRITIARPANKLTTFELWSEGIEKAAIIPGLKKV